MASIQGGACLWAGMLHWEPTSVQSGAPSSAASRLGPALPDDPSSPSVSGAMLLLQEDDGEAANPRHSSDAISI